MNTPDHRKECIEDALEYINHRRLALIDAKNRDGLDAADQVEFDRLQGMYFALLDLVHPGPQSDLEEIDRIEKRLEGP